MKFGLGEERLEISLVCGAANNSNIFSLQSFRPDIPDRAVAPRDETRRRAVVWIAEVEARAHFRRLGNRSYDGIPVIRIERVYQRIEPPLLHRASNLELFADQSRQIDVETNGCAVRAGVVEGRIVGLGKKADDVDPREVRPFGSPSGIPEAWHCHGVGNYSGRCRHCWADSRRRRRRLPRHRLLRMRDGGGESEGRHGKCAHNTACSMRAEIEAHPNNPSPNWRRTYHRRGNGLVIFGQDSWQRGRPPVMHLSDVSRSRAPAF
jgi:hypothetical protein